MKGVRREYIVENIETGEKQSIMTLHAVADFLGRSYSTVQFRYRNRLSIDGYWIYLPEDADKPRELMTTDKPRKMPPRKRREHESPFQYLSRCQTTMSTRGIANELGVSTREVEWMYDWLLEYRRAGGKVRDLNMVCKAADAVEVLSKLQSRKILESH